jgi:hypothetical protein
MMGRRQVEQAGLLYEFSLDRYVPLTICYYIEPVGSRERRRSGCAF